MQNHYQPGDIVLNNWTLVRQLGQGSYGTVFEARREDFGTTYTAAIKIISIPQNQGEIDNARAEGMDDESMTAYFREFVEEIVGEFALMARLKGTANVVSYEDHTVIPHENSIGWDIIIRMELLQPLFDFSKENEFTRQNIIKLGMDICRGLELCQKFNIIHRDIKPENIMVSELGDYKLGDFGIARTVDKTTSALTKRGTYTYMAPEVFNTGIYGPSVDIYSLGIVMYRLLNDNRTPFLPDYPEPISPRDRDTALIKRMGGKNPLPPPKNADGRLAEIVLKACAHDVNHRYSSPEQMRRELEAILYTRQEAPFIYPRGDEVPVKSNEYIEKEIEATEMLDTRPTVVIKSEEKEPVADMAKPAPIPASMKRLLMVSGLIFAAAVVLMMALFIRGNGETVPAHLPTETPAPTEMPASTPEPTPIPSPEPIPTPEPIIIPPVLSEQEINDEILKIRELWNASRTAITANVYASVTISPGVVGFIYNGQVRMIEVAGGTDGLDYLRIYQFNNNQLIFAYFEGQDAHRLYFKDSHMFRWRHTPVLIIPNDFIDYDNRANEEEFTYWENLALNEAQRLYVMAESIEMLVPNVTSFVVSPLSTGYQSSFYITPEGSLWAWGNNAHGQLGDGTFTNRLTPTFIKQDVKAVSSGVNHTLVIRTDGTLWVWGNNDNGQLGNGTFTTTPYPIQIMENVIYIDANNRNSAAITRDGILWMWGWNEWGQLGDGSTFDRNMPLSVAENMNQVSLGFYHTMAITADGRLQSWGRNEWGLLGDGTTADRLYRVTIMENMVQVSTSGWHTLAICNAGYLWGWGLNHSGRLGDGTTQQRNNPVRIMDNTLYASAGGLHSAVIRTDNSVWTWGSNTQGQLGDGTTDTRHTPTRILNNIAHICAGTWHTMAACLAGNVYAWGLNGSGRLGDGTTTRREHPVRVW